MALENIMEFYDDKHFTSGLTDLLPKHYQLLVLNQIFQNKSKLFYICL